MKREGFTLLEILVAVMIIMILTVAGVTSYTSVSRNARDARRKSDLEQIRQALEMYRADNGYYAAPGGNQWTFGNASNLSGLLVSTYTPVVPTDPRPSLGFPYQYMANNGAGSPTQFYGYCICTHLEGTSTTPSTCNPPNGNYTFCQKSP